ncbi:hypothetical protein T440DRAFT_494962 [Plenodomus tracheiphilus IPT5]|uniref:Trafficking protein particle complex II-specific subunit 65 IgD3 domain-containing protein n=1 Tax=Plenodomus tracheiphilus IPT5 TaxID=1408161 RepID=A0A6A7BLG4_9PLEO|nr:hypothetical protein T440DRAFT_494962 [Plenodomus tracheiphilus IPT5]
MPASIIEAQPRGSADFAESSVLEAVVPDRQNIDFKEALSSWDGTVDEENGSILPFLSQRHVILLDELLSVYAVFRTPSLEDDVLESYLSRLLVHVEAYAFSTAPSQDQDLKTVPPKELIHSGTVTSANEPQVIRHGEGDRAYSYVIWKVDVFIARPQGRFHKPVVYFQPTASFKPAERIKKDSTEDEYLPSRVPTALNLLQAFENDPALAGVHPRLSAMRISKITPNAPVAKEMVRPIRNGQRPLFRILPALIWRMRYSRVATSVSDMSLLASMDLEIAQFATHEVRIKEVSLKLNGGEVKTIADSTNATALRKPGDQLTYTYKIKPDVGADGTPSLGNKGHFLTLSISAIVLISRDCQPDIAIEWKTPIDFVSEKNSNAIKAAHRLSKHTSQDLKAPNPDALPAPDTQSPQELEAQSNYINVTLTISGPPQVQVGEMFTWDVFMINRSDKTRKLAILVIAKRKRDYEGRPTSSRAGVRDAEKRELLAPAVVDENIVYAKQKSSKKETAELVCLTTDIRLGSLSPGSCYTASLKFLALSVGVLSVESVRVIDLATNETADIRELPSIRRYSLSTHDTMNSSRQRLLYQLNSRWIYGKIPLLHAAVFLIQMAAVSLLARKYNSYYAQRPVLTTMITNAVLGGIADTVAQTLTAVRQRAVRKGDKDDFLAIEIHDLDRRNPFNENDLIPESKKLPPPFDFERTTRFMSYGFLMSPIQHRWFRFLSATFPVTKTATWLPALKRVAFDQFLFAPAGLACFFTFMTIAEGGGKRAVQRKFQDVYVPALKANFLIWPTVQIINFRVMPIQYQIPFVSTVGIAWTAYLSLTNSAEEA